MEKIDGSQFVRRTKQWTPTVYRVGRTGESLRISTKIVVSSYAAFYKKTNQQRKKLCIVGIVAKK